MKLFRRIAYGIASLSILLFPLHSKSDESIFVLSKSQLDTVSAGAVPYTGKYRGNIAGDDTGKFKFVVSNSGTVNGFVKFNEGGRVKVRGAVGDDGTFGAVLLGQRKKWGIGGIWGNFSVNTVSGVWSRPNNLVGSFYGNR